MANIHSAHLTLDIGVDTAKITGAGDEQVVGGKVKALQITENLPGSQQIRIVYVDGKTYAKLPASLAKSSKPYILVSPTSSNATIRTLAQSINSSLQSASVQSATVFAKAASSVKRIGSATVGGVQTTHYAVTVDPQKLPADLPGKSTLTAAGITAIPVELYVDSSGRPVQDHREPDRRRQEDDDQRHSQQVQPAGDDLGAAGQPGVHRLIGATACPRR